MIKTKGVSTTVVQNNQILLLCRKSKRFNGLWMPVGGKREQDETAIQTVLREIKEEIGVSAQDIQSLYNTDRCYTTYSAKDDTLYVYPTFFIILKGNINININEEHSEYKWCSVDEAFNLLSMPLQKEEIIYIDKYFIKSKPSEFLKIDLDKEVSLF